MYILILYTDICCKENKKGIFFYKYAYCVLNKYNFGIFLKQSKIIL